MTFRHRPGQNLRPNSLYGMSSSSVDSCRHVFSLPVIPTPVKKTGLAALHLCVLLSERRQNNLHAFSYKDTDWLVQIIELVPAHAFGTLEISPQASYYLLGSPNFSFSLGEPGHEAISLNSEGHYESGDVHYKSKSLPCSEFLCSEDHYNS